MGLTPEQLRQVLFFGADTTGFSALPEAQQKRLLRELFHWQQFAKAGEVVKGKARALTERYAADSLKLERLRGQEAEARRYLAFADGAVERARTEKQVDAQKIQDERKDVDRRLGNLMGSISAWEAEQQEAEQHGRTLATHVQELDALNDRITELRQTKVCPVCERPLPRKPWQAQLEAAKARKRRLVVELKDAEAHLDPERAAALAEQIVQGKKQSDELTGTLHRLDAAQHYIGQDLKAFGQKQAHCRVRFQTCKRARVWWETRVAQLERRCQHWEWWKDGFGSRGIETLALAASLPTFNAAVNAVLAELPTAEGLMRCRYLMDGEHLVQRIRYQGGTRYKLLSGGERRRLDFAVAYVFQQYLPRETNVWWLDEAFDGLDALGVQGCLGVLANSGKESIFVTSHRDELTQWFPTVIRLAHCRIVEERQQAIDVTRLIARTPNRKEDRYDPQRHYRHQAQALGG